jgi:hypothetical protein
MKTKKAGPFGPASLTRRRLSPGRISLNHKIIVPWAVNIGCDRHHALKIILMDKEIEIPKKAGPQLAQQV